MRRTCPASQYDARMCCLVMAPISSDLEVPYDVLSSHYVDITLTATIRTETDLLRAGLTVEGAKVCAPRDHACGGPGDR